MTLLEGEILWNLVWVLPLIWFLFYYAWFKRTAVLKLFFGKRSDDPRYVSVSASLRFWRGVILTAVLFLLFVAAARPSWGVSILPYTGHGRDLMVVFDTSKSMLSQDVRPSRLEHAKWLVRQLAENNPGDRFGLIAFAGHAFLECPLTIDKTSFLQTVSELATDSIPVGGTNLEKALGEAVRGFRAAETSFRAILLITDGDELTGDSGKALEEIIRLKIPLFILGVGDPSQPSIIQVPDADGNIHTLKDSSGNIVNAPLNEKQLSLLARKTGGIYVRSTTTHPGIAEVEARIKKLDVREMDSGKQTRPIERPVYPLLAAFFLLCLWFALPEKRSGKSASVKTILLISALLGGAGLSAQEQAAPSESVSPAGQETRAVPEKAQKLSPVVLYNEGLKAQTGEKDPAKATALYEQAISASGAETEVRSRSCQNLGVLNHQASRELLQKAQESLRRQQLDQALQQTDASLKQLCATEDIYKESMRDGRDILPVSKNQQLLLRDRKSAEDFKKKLEELKKKQQEARQNTQKALDQQQQKDQQKQQQQGQQQQQKQDQQKQPQNQQGQQQQDQQKPQDQTQKARESTRELEKQAKDLNQEKLEEQARKAGEELDKAKDAQARKNDRQAEDHLKKALEQLGNQDRKDPKDQPKDDKDQKDQKDDKDRELPKNGKLSNEGQNGRKEEEKEIDKEQAKALLDLMANDEKQLKEELKERMKRNYGIRPVEKDW
ncbi:MAG: von Willebrand factor type A domain protein [Lentisphaerae bacterium ADurb.Bin242]|nr:MAG: von Willebrand factor type A domain protein [Lentisphaerae bacterium ADurb.Bin242]